MEDRCSMWEEVSRETEAFRTRGREAMYWNVIDRQTSPVQEAVATIRERYDYMADRTPLEIYADSLMEEKGMEVQDFMGPDIMAKLRVMQLRSVGFRDVVIVRDVQARMPSGQISALGPKDVLSVVQVGDIMWPASFDEEASEKLTAEELYGKEVIVPDRVEQSATFMAWVDRAVELIAERRMERLARTECACGGAGVAATFSHLTEAQQEELGHVSGRYASRRFRNNCLCCTRSAYMREMYGDYGSFSDKLRGIFWVAEERAARRLVAKELKRPQVIRYASTNPEKVQAMGALVAAEMPGVRFEGHTRNDEELQGTFGEIVVHKATNVSEMVLVDDAGFFDDTGYPGTVAKQVYGKRPYMFQGSHRAIVVMGMDTPDGVIMGVGTQFFDAAYTGPGRAWSDLMFPEGVGGGRDRDMPSDYQARCSARARAFFMVARKMGWVF